VLSILRRLVRNPKKYGSRDFWSSLTLYLRKILYFRAVYVLPALVRRMFGARPLRVYVFPLPMGRYLLQEVYVTWKLFWFCNLDIITEHPERADLAIAWNPCTAYEPDEALLQRLESSMRVINSRSTDIRKSTVDAAQKAVFGYALAVDPTAYAGPIVRKSEKNGAHDGCVMQGPISHVDPGYVYQRFVSYPTPLGFAEWRVYIVARTPVMTSVSYRSEKRFAAKSDKCAPVPIEQAFSPWERERIGAFCERMCLDVGVLDVLRDADGRVYVSDCNNAACGPSMVELRFSEQMQIMRALGRAFEREYLAPLRKRRVLSHANATG
jgi:hypothetical protein